MLLHISAGQAGLFWLLPGCRGTMRVVTSCVQRFLFCLFFKKYPYYISQAGLQLLSSSTSQVLAFQVCTTTFGSRMLTLNKATCSAWAHGRVCSPKIRRVFPLGKGWAKFRQVLASIPYKTLLEGRRALAVFGGGNEGWGVRLRQPHAPSCLLHTGSQELPDILSFLWEDGRGCAADLETLQGLQPQAPDHQRYTGASKGLSSRSESWSMFPGGYSDVTGSTE